MAAVFDLLVLLPVLAAVAFAFFYLARGLGRSRTGAGAAGLAARQAATGPSARGLRGSRAVLRLAGMTVLVAVAAAILLVFSAQLGAFDPVIDSPSPGAPIGVWKGGGGATLVLAADATFQASGLPAGIGDWADGSTPPAGRGSWHVGRFDDSTPIGVIFSFSNGSRAELQLEHDGSSLALFYDLGDPDEGWSGQYRFVRQ